jgi:hypothetical protein
MHGVANTFRFLRLHDELHRRCTIDKIPVEPKTHAGNPGANCARGVMQHPACASETTKSCSRCARPFEGVWYSDRSTTASQIDLLRGARKSRVELSWSNAAIDARVDRPGGRCLDSTSAMELARY